MLRNLPTDELHTRDDARTVNPDAVSALADSIAAIGLINPVRVRPNGNGWEIIAGQHRVAACQSLGLVEIACDVVEDDDESSELAKIDENVFRQELSSAELARDMARRKQIYEIRNPPIRANQYTGQRNSQELGTPLRFTAHVAEVTGQSEATIQQQVSRGENILPEVIDLIRGTSLDKDVYLDKLKRLPGNEQVQVAERDLAIERSRQRAVEPIRNSEVIDRQVASLMSAWNKASGDARQIFMERISK